MSRQKQKEEARTTFLHRKRRLDALCRAAKARKDRPRTLKFLIMLQQEVYQYTQLRQTI